MSSLHHIVTFSSTFPSEWQFDEDGNPTEGGGLECIEFLRSRLLTSGFSAEDIWPRDYYGWEFIARLQRVPFHFVLTTTDDSFYLHLGVSLAALQTVLLRQPAQRYEQLRTVLEEVFQSEQFSDVHWQTRSAYEAEERQQARKARERMAKRSKSESK